MDQSSKRSQRILMLEKRNLRREIWRQGSRMTLENMPTMQRGILDLVGTECMGMRKTLKKWRAKEWRAKMTLADEVGCSRDSMELVNLIQTWRESMRTRDDRRRRLNELFKCFLPTTASISRYYVHCNNNSE